MAVIVKSDGLNYGAISGYTRTGLQITAASYTARVVADGGSIVDSAALTTLFTFLGAQGISPRNFIWGTSFGVRTCNGVIDKIYALNGNDLVRINPGSLINEMFDLDSASTYATFKNAGVEASASGRNADGMQTQGLGYLMRPGDTTFIVAGTGKNLVSADGFYNAPFCAGVPNGLPPYACAIIGYNNDVATNLWQVIIPQGSYNPTVSATNFTQAFTVSTPYSDWPGIAVHADTVAGQINAWANGVQTLTNQAVANGGVWNSSTTPIRFFVNAILAAGGVTKTIQNQQRYAEVWHVSGGTAAQALAISSRLHSLYV